MIGLALPLDMYKAERAAEIRKDPNVRLVFNRVEITLEVKAQAIKQKQDGVTLMQNAVNLWRGLGLSGGLQRLKCREARRYPMIILSQRS